MFHQTMSVWQDSLCCFGLVFIVLYCFILLSTNSSLVFPRYMYFWMELIIWYVDFSLTVATSPSFSMRCAADVSFSNCWKAHVFDIPKKWLMMSQPVKNETEVNTNELFFQNFDTFF